MDKKSQERLEQILRDGPRSASQEDLEFLAARRSYLNGGQLKTFGIQVKKVAVQTAPVAPVETEVVQFERKLNLDTQDPVTENGQPVTPPQPADPVDDYSDGGADPDA